MLYESGGYMKTVIDQLDYSYEASDNQLKAVEDQGNAVGFNNNGVSLTGSEYLYDANGNLIEDKNKGLKYEYSAITGKVKKVSKANAPNDYILYRYDAGGNRLSTAVYANDIKQKETYSVNGFVYEGTIPAGELTETVKLSYFAMSEGRVRNEGGALRYEFFLQDHLGNVRAVVSKGADGSPVVEQETHYYPFGMRMPGLLSSVAAGENKQLYNAASKWQDEWGSDLPGTYTTFYREYDPVLGRFQAVDPKAEVTLSMTPYHYTGNNPVMFNDPLGDMMLADIISILDGMAGTNGGATWTNDGSEDGSYELHKTEEDARAVGNAYTSSHRDLGFYRQKTVSTYDPGPNGRQTLSGSVTYSSYYVFDEAAYEEWVSELGYQNIEARFFEDETEAYKYMWRNSFKNGKVWRENSAWILKGGGVIVLPTQGFTSISKKYVANSRSVSHNSYLKLSKDSGKYFVHFTKFLSENKYEIIGHVHTHPNEYGDGGPTLPSKKNGRGDFGILEDVNVPIFTIGRESIYQGMKISGQPVNIYLGTQKELFNGSLSLIDIIKNP